MVEMVNPGLAGEGKVIVYCKWEKLYTHISVSCQILYEILPCGGYQKHACFYFQRFTALYVFKVLYLYCYSHIFSDALLKPRFFKLQLLALGNHSTVYYILL